MQFLNTKRSDDQTKNARPKISPKISYPASLLSLSTKWVEINSEGSFFISMPRSTFLFNFSTMYRKDFRDRESLFLWAFVVALISATPKAQKSLP